MTSPVTLETILAARERIRDVIYHSPCPYSLQLSRFCDSQIYCKLDHLQMTGSFKERGARNKLLMLDEAQKQAGVIAASAGNHALGLAYHGLLLSIPVTVVMPKWAPLVKVSNCRSFGANVILHGETFDEARERATTMAREEGKLFVPAFDDPDIISGQGTLGLEILEDLPDVDTIIVPIGGGGLVAGIGTAVKSMKPSVRIIGVEPAAAPTMHESLKCGELTRVTTRPTLADGLAVARAGEYTFQIARKVLDDLILVDEAQIAKAVLRLLELEKTVVEGAGAVSLAAAMMPALNLRNQKTVLVLCGGNIDVTLISRVIERGLASDGRLTRLTAFISDRPGTLAHVLSVIAETGASINQVSHDRNFGPADIAQVAVHCVVETRDQSHIEQLHAALNKAGIEFTVG